jgi:hypothetical protein
LIGSDSPQLDLCQLQPPLPETVAGRELEFFLTENRGFSCKDMGTEEDVGMELQLGWELMLTPAHPHFWVLPQRGCAIV